MERVHYSAMREHFGLCLPLLLQAMDHCTDSVVRLVGLDALHLLIDRAMAVEVQNFVPAIEQFYGTASPLFLDGDDLAPCIVAPYCAGHVLFLLKAHTGDIMWRRGVID